MADLEGKRVQFELTGPDVREIGVGHLLVRQRPSGEQCIEITVVSAITPTSFVQRRFMLGQFHADRIQRHPEPATAEFQLFA